MRVRPAANADLPAITAIYAHWVLHGTASFENEAPSEAEMAARFERALAGGYPFLVADEEGAVAGYAYASAYRPRAAYRHTVENSVYLHPTATGRGVGRALLTELIAACAGRGYEEMVAVIGDAANAASIGLHTSLGFRHVGTLTNVGRKFGRLLDTVLMQRTLR